MSKTPITWIGLLQEKMKLKGKGTSIKDVAKDAKKDWENIKLGKHPKYIKGDMMKTMKRKTNKTKKTKKIMKKKKQMGGSDYCAGSTSDAATTASETTTPTASTPSASTSASEPTTTTPTASTPTASTSASEPTTTTTTASASDNKDTNTMSGGTKSGKKSGKKSAKKGGKKSAKKGGKKSAKKGGKKSAKKSAKKGGKKGGAASANMDELKVKVFFTPFDNDDLPDINLNNNAVSNQLVNKLFNIVKNDLNKNMSIYTDYDNKFKNAQVKCIKQEGDYMIIQVTGLDAGYMKKNDFKDNIQEVLIQQFNPQEINGNEYNARLTM
jgi:hypothetical protein